MADFPKVLYRFPQLAGKPFRPSNGTEGMIFDESFCSRCIHEKWCHTQNDADKKCDIVTKAMVYDTTDKDYPKEWIFNQEGWPICTAWQKWDWGKDDDGNWIDPVIPEPPDPNQLDLSPIYPDERNFSPSIEYSKEVER